MAIERLSVTMRRLTLGARGRLSLLAVGAHADDIEIGAGATILRLLAEHPGSTVLWVVASATPDRAAEARGSAAAFSADAAEHEVIVGNLPDGRLPAHVPALKDLLESVKSREIDLILAPHVYDSHQDHRAVAETVWQTFRNHLVAEYEIPKYDGDLGRPNLYADIDETTLARKIDLLQAHFPSQRDRSWWGGETVRAIARLRGIEAATHFAEAFHCRKIVL
jgi:LmbE family N-acetylglucosaminyl deacetylase